MIKRPALAMATLALSLCAAACGWAKPAPGAVEDVAPATEACGPQPGKLPRENLQVKTDKGPRHFDVEIAATDLSREYGLMCRPKMTDHHGMLFEFATPAEQTFWMKNTYIPLDIIYIDKAGRIVSIARNAKPFDETPLPSFGPATGVLEINGGLADRLGIKPGDQVDHRFFSSH